MRNWKQILLLTIIFAGCKKAYNPPAITAPNSYLVVEGVINTNDSTIVKLSRTVNLSSKVTTNPVSNAVLTIESDANDTYSLNEIVTGKYAFGGFPLDNTHKYRLRIKTPDNQEYLSDFVAVKVTPPIDSVGFTTTGNGLQIYANTHDPKNSTRYYRFDYDETWQFHSKYFSNYVSNGVSIEGRTADQDIYHCFASDVSSTIIIGSTAKLTADVLYQQPVTNIISTSEKIETKYSILLREYALTADAYKFWDNLKKNTEQLGSIFDAQPSQISGNIHNTAKPAEPVVGYISAGTVSSKRIFISYTQLPQTWLPAYPDATCSQDSIWYDTPHSHFNGVAAYLIPLPAAEIPVSGIFAQGSPSPVGYLSSSVECVDCTLRGTKTQPAFWK
ncbi:DUF4249 domain-containing protein [Mucilaginibacter sp.]|uniref:DUF4249 domain-containing protein n=1 Tax=Mucilaginibacter sp. TaxID=1882438 RepID=UPI003D0E38D2